MTDCVRSTEKALGKKLASLNVDGGACQSDFLMQFQADMFGFPLNRPTQIEMTALGAAYAGGIAVGFWTLDEVTKFWKLDRTFEPKMSEDERESRYAQWLRAVSRAKDWADKTKP
jgi:glycerol kinase